MGNALDFLENRDKTKRKHQSTCQTKIDKYLKEHGTTLCPDHELIRIIGSRTDRVNLRDEYRSSLPGINSRRYQEKKHANCECCGADFIPAVRKCRVRKEVVEKYGTNMTVWCFRCEQADHRKRNMVRKCNGWDEYTGRVFNIRGIEWIQNQQSFRLLFDELDNVLFLERGHCVIDNQIEKLIHKAFEENELKILRESHYDFDF